VHYAPMLEVGYLHIDNPIAVISSQNHPEFSNAAGLLLLDGFDLDEVSLEDMQAGLVRMKAGRAKGERMDGDKGSTEKGAIGISVTCSRDEPLLEAARLASRNLSLLDLRLNKIRDPVRLLELIPRLKRCGVTLSLRIRPEDLFPDLLEKLNESELDIIHLDLRGLNGAGPRIVKKAKDCRGPPSWPLLISASSMMPKICWPWAQTWSPCAEPIRSLQSGSPMPCRSTTP